MSGLTLLAVLCAWLSGLCWGMKYQTFGESELILKWCGLLLGISAAIVLMTSVVVRV